MTNLLPVLSPLLLPLIIAAFLVLIAGTALSKKILRVEGQRASTHLFLLLFGTTLATIYVAIGRCIREGSIANILSLLIISATFLLLFLAFASPDIVKNGHSAGDVGALLLLAAAAAVLAVNSNNLLIMIVALSGAVTACLAVANMEGLPETRLVFTMPAIIYLITVFMIIILGAVLLYGAVNTFDLIEIIKYHELDKAPALTLFWTGIIIIILALLTFMPLFPFNFLWPELIAGGKTVGVAAFFSTVSLTAVGLWLKFAPLFATKPKLMWCLAVLAVITMFFGALVALRERVLSALIADVIIYLAGEMLLFFTIAFKNSGNIAHEIIIAAGPHFITIIALLGLKSILQTESNSYAVKPYKCLTGLWRRSPFLAAALIFILFSLAGIPLTAGFTLSLSLLRVLATLSLTFSIAFALANIMMLSAAVRLVYTICFTKSEAEIVPKFSKYLLFLLMISLGLLVLWGIMPDVPLLLLGGR